MTNIEKWPCYIIFNDDTIVIFKRDIPKHLFKIEKKKVKDFGIIDRGKWTCWSNKGEKPNPSVESTCLIRKFLCV
jgi:hypothetical protein